jgi:ABC-type oligopeptide transport system ATPase subunit
MQDLQQQTAVAFLFIAHDLAVVRHVADRIAVMYLGSIMEIGNKRQIYATPHHPYTQALLSAGLGPTRTQPTAASCWKAMFQAPPMFRSDAAFTHAARSSPADAVKKRPH